MATEPNRSPRFRRRPPRPTPLRRLRIGPAFAAAGRAPAIPFPGFHLPEPGSRTARALAALLAIAVHAALFGAIVYLGALVPELPEEEVIPVQLLHELPEPVQRAEPAPAPKALAERRSVDFAPNAQAITPQVVNPKVIARAAPSVAAETLEVEGVASSAAPRRIERAAVAVQTVKAVTPVAGSEPRRLEVADAGAPALRGPIEARAPVGPSVGPKAVVSTGDTVGTAPGPVQLGDGSSVREGITSTRDVLGSADGPRLASVNTRVGEGLLHGPGGSGTGANGQAPDCFERPAVKAYWGTLQDRMYARWALPPDLPPGTVEVKLRFRLDPSGSATRVELLPGGDPRLGKSAIDALRSASPFPPMPDEARCLAGRQITGVFRKRPLAN